MWLDESGKVVRVQRAPRQRCEVCIDRSTAMQAIDDAKTVAILMPQTKAALARIEELERQRWTWLFGGVLAGVLVGAGALAGTLLAL